MWLNPYLAFVCMIIPKQYKTGNKKMDEMIARKLESEARTGDTIVFIPEEKRGKFNVSAKEQRTYRLLSKGQLIEIVFDSKIELDRYEELLLLQKSGAISGLEIQKKFVLLDKSEYTEYKMRGVKYYADFYYIEKGKQVVEEWKVKATRTKDYKIKKKMFHVRYPEIEFREMVHDELRWYK